MKKKVLELLKKSNYLEDLNKFFDKNENKIKIYEILFEIIRTHHSTDIIERAINFLAIIRPIAFSHEILIDQLTNKNQKIRMASARALSILKLNSTEPVLAQLKNTKAANDQIEIIWLLGKIGQKEDICVLKRMKDQLDPKSERLRLEAIDKAIEEITLRFVSLWFKEKKVEEKED